ncbi:MAG: 6,7-dimethyl-8-ribityllumazine synthase [Pelagibacteraceae bacterium]
MNVLIVIANYYPEISKELKISAIDKLKNNNYDIINVPGIFEIPVVISRNINKYDAFIALGCVIKGETPHFEFISKSFNDGIMKISIDYKKPIGNGVITCLNKDQAKNRTKKGSEAAEAIIQVLKNG